MSLTPMNQCAGTPLRSVYWLGFLRVRYTVSRQPGAFTGFTTGIHVTSALRPIRMRRQLRTLATLLLPSSAGMTFNADTRPSISAFSRSSKRRSWYMRAALA